MNINELQNKIAELEKENAYLKGLLDNAGISYAPVDAEGQPSQVLFDEDQGSRIVPVQLTHNV